MVAQLTARPGRTQVGIVGAGPAGLLLSHLLARRGIDSVVVELRSRAYSEARQRAGVLEQGSVDLLRAAGLGERLDREGLEHGGIYLQFDGERRHLDFRDLAGEFEQAGAQRVGISMDSVDKQQGFGAKHGAGYPLLSDPDGVVARQFGVKRKFGPLRVKRATFVIGTDHTVLGVINSELNMNAHADRALAVLRPS